MKSLFRCKQEIEDYQNEIKAITSMTLKDVAANYNVDATNEDRDVVIDSINEEIDAIEKYIEANAYDLYADERDNAMCDYADLMNDCRKER